MHENQSELVDKKVKLKYEANEIGGKRNSYRRLVG